MNPFSCVFTFFPHCKICLIMGTKFLSPHFIVIIFFMQAQASLELCHGFGETFCSILLHSCRSLVIV